MIKVQLFGFFCSIILLEILIKILNKIPSIGSAVGMSIQRVNITMDTATVNRRGATRMTIITRILPVPSVDSFKALDMKERNQTLRDLRKLYSDKEIRDEWGMKYSTFYYYIKQANFEEEKERKRSKLQPKPQINRETNNTNITYSDKIIDADYTIVEESKELPIMNFKDVVGNMEQIEKRLDSISTLLGMEGKETKFRLNIQVYKV
jgi:hypothetical protein